MVIWQNGDAQYVAGHVRANYPNVRPRNVLNASPLVMHSNKLNKFLFL